MWWHYLFSESKVDKDGFEFIALGDIVSLSKYSPNWFDVSLIVLSQGLVKLDVKFLVITELLYSIFDELRNVLVSLEVGYSNFICDVSDDRVGLLP